MGSEQDSVSFTWYGIRKTQRKREKYAGSKCQPLHPQVSLSVIEITAWI